MQPTAQHSIWPHIYQVWPLDQSASHAELMISSCLSIDVHRGLNQRKGILFDRDHDLDDIPEQEIQSELESQGWYLCNDYEKT